MSAKTSFEGCSNQARGSVGGYYELPIREEVYTHAKDPITSTCLDEQAKDFVIREYLSPPVEGVLRNRKEIASLFSTEGAFGRKSLISGVWLAKDIQVNNPVFRGMAFLPEEMMKLENTELPNRVQILDGEWANLFGTVRYEVVEDLMKDSGMEPVKFSKVGKELAVLQVFFNTIRDSSLGPYTELIFMTHARKVGSQRRAIEWVNSASTLTPYGVQPTLYLLKLYLDMRGGKGAVYGRTRLGTDKLLVPVLDLVSNVGAGTFSFNVKDEVGNLVIEGVLPIRMEEDFEKESADASKGVIEDAFRVGKDYADIDSPTATRLSPKDPLHVFGFPGVIKDDLQFFTGLQESGNGQTDKNLRVKIGNNSEWGGLLGKMEFKPQLFHFAPTYHAVVIEEGMIKGDVTK